MTQKWNTKDPSHHQYRYIFSNSSPALPGEKSVPNSLEVPFLCNEFMWAYTFRKQRHQPPYHYCPCLWYSIIQTWHWTPTSLSYPSSFRLYHHHIQTYQTWWILLNNNYTHNRWPRSISNQPLGRNHILPLLLPWLWPLLDRLHIIWWKTVLKHHKPGCQKDHPFFNQIQQQSQTRFHWIRYWYSLQMIQSFSVYVPCQCNNFQNNYNFPLALWCITHLHPLENHFLFPKNNIRNACYKHLVQCCWFQHPIIIFRRINNT